MKINIGLQCYDRDILGRLCESRPDGVILGDILCEKRMFKSGNAEMVEMLFELKDKNIKVFMQTPMYVTDRIFGKVTDTIECFAERELIQSVIVQDVGAAQYLRNHLGEMEIIWGRMGYARTPVINLSTLRFYKEIGVSSIECKDVMECQVAEKYGFHPYLLLGTPAYTTINRECYYKYEHNIYENDCGRGCLKQEKIIIPGKQNIDTTIDGFVLGYKNIYSRANITAAKDQSQIMLYADGLNEAMEIWGKLK